MSWGGKSSSYAWRIEFASERAIYPHQDDKGGYKRYDFTCGTTVPAAHQYAAGKSATTACGADCATSCFTAIVCTAPTVPGYTLTPVQLDTSKGFAATGECAAGYNGKVSV